MVPRSGTAGQGRIVGVPAAAPPRSAGSVTAGRPRPRVVLVEDHVRVREHLTKLLEASGFDVVAAAATYAEGHAAVLAERPGLAVLDNRLPDGRGVDLAAVLHREAPEVGLVVHSGAISTEEAEFARRCGALEVVTKDVRARPLVEALWRHATRATGGRR